MSSPLYYLILIILVSTHACESRPLTEFHKRPAKESHLLTNKTPELVADQLQGRNVNEDNVKQKEFKLEFPSNEQQGREGGDIKVQISQEENNLRGWKNHARSTMESKLQDSKEAINKSNENSLITEDVVVMDYAQPHRKPPIHNITP